MKNLKVLALTAAVAAASLTSVSAYADLSANAALTSNYVWRGFTQTDDSVAVQGGLDWSGSGFYAGTWLSTVDFTGNDSDVEYDLYGGYNLELSESMSLDFGVIRYDYLDANDADVVEVYAGIAVSDFGAYVYIDTDSDGAIYFTADYSMTFGDDFGVKGYIGAWDFDTAATGLHYGVEASKTWFDVDFSLTVDISDEDLADDTYVWVMASKSFDL